MIDILLMLCGTSAGTVTMLENNQYVSAEHVPVCHNIVPTFTDAVKDFAMGTTNQATGLKYSCERIVTGQTYTLMGYHDNRIRTFEFVATPYVVEVQSLGRRGLRGLTGLALPGMSGGPVLNSRGEVVAIISTRNLEHNLTLVSPLSESPLCRAE